MTPEEIEVRRRMAEQELYLDYGPGLEELEEKRVQGKVLAAEYNNCPVTDTIARQQILKQMLGSLGNEVWIEQPISVAYGSHTFIGDNVYINFGLTAVDDSEIHIGNQVMFGPNVTITTAGHPLHPQTRATNYQFSAPVIIEDQAWIGANVTILPGVTIGAGSVVGAGAVVTANVPPMTIVAGVPAKIIRSITEDDKEWHWRAPKTLEK